MAARKPVSRTKVKNEEVEMAWTPPTPTETKKSVSSSNSGKRKVVLTVAVLLALLLLWWWKTNSWPIVAMVGNTPITRHEISQNLFSQYGQTTIEGIITQKQIEAELKRQNIQVDSGDVDKRIEEIKNTLGPGADFEAELKSRGMDMGKLKELITLQLKLNKAVESQASVSAEEVDNYVKQNGQFLSGTTDAEKKAEAEQILKQEKANTQIEAWVEEAKKKTNVWRLYPVPTTPPAPTMAPPTPQVTPTVTPKK